MKKFLISLFLWLAILLALFLPGFIKDTAISIGGSTSVYPLFAQLNALGQKNNINYRYNSLGSSAGFLRTKSNTFAVGFLSKEAPSNLPSNMKSFTLAIEGIIFVYHLPSSCKMKKEYPNLKKTELRNLFLQTKAYWSSLSGFDCSKKERIYRINREEGSGTRTIFEKKTEIKKYSKDKTYHFEHLSKHSGDILKLIQQTPGSISYLSYFYKTKIKLMNNTNINFFRIDDVEASFDNFGSNKYFFVRPFVGLYLIKNKYKIKNFLKFLASDAVEKEFIKLGLNHKFKLSDVNKIYEN